MLGTKQFSKLDNDPTSKLESKIQRTLRKIKSKLPEKVYRKLYLTGSCPGKFYGNAKVHKLLTNNADDLPLRPIISNIGTATYETAKYLANLLAPLGKSKYTITNTKEFVKYIQKQKVLDGYKMVSFDVVSLFTNVPLEQAIEIILKRIYINKEITTNIPKQEMKELLFLCTKNVHFTFNNQIYIQLDGVAMDSPLGPVLANIFMVELETSVISNLNDKIKLWKKFVDDTICFAKSEYTNNILLALSSFHQNIKFTFETEKDDAIPFLDVLIIRKARKIETAVYRKKTCTDLYMNWYSYALNNWKWGTLRTLVRRGHVNWSTKKYLEDELKHIRKTFNEINNYPHWVITKVFKETTSLEKGNQIDEATDKNSKNHLLILPYKGEKGAYIINSMKRTISKILPENIKIRLSTCFKTKDKTKFEHQHDIIYHVRCSAENCPDDYIEEAARRVVERVKDHGGRDTKSHMFKHSIEKEHKEVTQSDFKIIGSHFNNNRHKRKIAEALLLKKKRPSLNVQEQSIDLKLLN